MSGSSLERPHLSHSSLRQLQSCGTQYRLQRLDRIERSHRSPALVLGSCYHVTLAEGLLRLERDGELEQDWMVERFDEIWKAETQIESPPIRWTARAAEDSQHELGRSMIGAWHEQALPIFLDAEQIIAVELGFRIPIRNSRGDVLTLPMDGVIDCIYKTTGGAIIVADHKTCSSSGSFSETFLDLDLQSAIYCAAAKHLGYGDCKFQFHTLSKSKRSPTFNVIDVERGADSFDRLFWIASQAERLIEAGIFLPATAGWQCESCEYKSACKAVHRAEQPVLTTAV